MTKTVTEHTPVSQKKRSQSSISQTGAKAEAPRYTPPLTISHEALLANGGDHQFRAAVYLMNMVLSRLQTCRESFGALLGLTGTQFAVLLGVAHEQNGSGVTIRKLADHLSIAAPHVTTEVGRMVDMGLLMKDRHDTDRRSVLTKLTSKGREYVEQVSPVVLKINDYLFEGVEETEFKALLSCFSKISINSERALAELRIYKIQAVPAQ